MIARCVGIGVRRAREIAVDRLAIRGGGVVGGDGVGADQIGGSELLAVGVEIARGHTDAGVLITLVRQRHIDAVTAGRPVQRQRLAGGDLAVAGLPDERARIPFGGELEALAVGGGDVGEHGKAAGGARCEIHRGRVRSAAFDGQGVLAVERHRQLAVGHQIDAVVVGLVVEVAHHDAIAVGEITAGDRQRAVAQRALDELVAKALRIGPNGAVAAILELAGVAGQGRAAGTDAARALGVGDRHVRVAGVDDVGVVAGATAQ